MLKLAYEWLRIVYPKPDNGIVEARTKSVGDLLGRLDQANDRELLGAFLTSALAGFEGRLDPDAPQIGTVVESIRKTQPAFPSDLTENALELRVTCALAIGELLVNGPGEGRASERLAAAMLVLTGGGLRPEEEGRHLRSMAAELARVAEAAIRDRAMEMRSRPEFDLGELDAIDSQGDLPTFWSALLPALRNRFELAEDRSRADREELEVLWWLYSAYSEALGRPLASLPGNVAVLACGVEVGDRVLLPPHPGASEMVADAVLRNRKKSEFGPRSFASLAADWDDPARKLLVPGDESCRRFALTFPALLPLTWLAMRLTESRGARGWEGEFEQRIGIPPSHEYDLPTFARQAFRERVAQRLISEGGGA